VLHSSQNFSFAFKYLKILNFICPLIHNSRLNSLKIKTANTVLEPISLEFAGDIFTNFTLEITRFMVPRPPRALSNTETFVKDCITKRSLGVELVMVILSANTREFYGCVGLHFTSSPLTPDLGISLKKNAQGFGLGKQALFGIYDWASKALEIECFFYRVDKNNLASRRLAERLGGVAFSDQIVPTQNNAQLHEIIYRIDPLKSEKFTHI
jgi:[ribosomal protein S5]-alanine N-acetyltransferase